MSCLKVCLQCGKCSLCLGAPIALAMQHAAGERRST